MDGPVHMTGHGVGGMVITQAASQRPQARHLIYVDRLPPQPQPARPRSPISPEARPAEPVPGQHGRRRRPPVATMPPATRPRPSITAAPRDHATDTSASGHRDALHESSGRTVTPQHCDGLRRGCDVPAGPGDQTCPAEKLMYTGAGCDPVVEIDTEPLAVVFSNR